MPDPSLFPNPPTPNRPKRAFRRAPVDACCAEWADFVAQRERSREAITRPQAFVHKWGHSRTPFSLVKLTELSGCSTASATTAIRVGMRRKWIVVVPSYTPDATPLWVGVL